jgi:hypothetical protein
MNLLQQNKYLRKSGECRSNVTLVVDGVPENKQQIQKQRASTAKHNIFSY